VSRLFDRIRAEGARPLRASDLTANLPDFRARMLASRPADVPLESVDDVIRAGRTRTNAIRGREGLRPEDLPVMPVVVADNVGRYFAEVHTGVVDVGTIVSTLLPPFREMFVDIQGAPNDLGMKAWGVHLRVIHDAENPNPNEPDDAWVVEAIVFAEWRTGEPVGPVGEYLIPLDAEGHQRPRDREGYGSLFGGVVELAGMPDDAREHSHQLLLRPLAAALLTISLMHCKNVDAVEIDPPIKLSNRHRREHGTPLTRYRVLNIDPMRRVLSRDGQAESAGLRHALHICRGHFKVFTDEAPLFGRHTGTYWWAEQLRGDRRHGVVVKDYRIKIADAGLGENYEPADEHVELAQAEEHKGRDPDLGGRGLRAHNVTQNALAEAVARAGFTPRRPRPEEPQYDVAWETPEAIWVAEVKSLTRENEEKQLRLALGQVLRYRQLLDGGEREVKAMIATENRPTDERWLDLCAAQQVVLVWDGAFDHALTS
jgi:hypothetical protein